MARLTLDDFEKFTDKRRVATHDPVFTIGKGGRIGINKYAYENYIKAYKHVEFYYKADENIIALKLLKRRTATAYDIKKAPNSNNGAVNATAFFKHHDINVSAKRTTEFIEADEENAVIYLKVNPFRRIMRRTKPPPHELPGKQA
jgi:hypothetical protein